MSTLLDDEILKDFISETKYLVMQLLGILEEAESGEDQSHRLETYGQVVDRIMGGAKSLALDIKDMNHPIHKIADYSAVCKAVGYKTSQIQGNPDFYSLCVALLMDATEVLNEILESLEKNQQMDIKEVVSQTLIDRVKWVSKKFSAEFRSSVAINKQSPQKMTQDEIDALLSKLGF